MVLHTMHTLALYNNTVHVTVLIILFQLQFLDLSNLPNTVSGKTSHWPFRNYVEELLNRSDCPAGSYSDVTYQDVFKYV